MNATPVVVLGGINMDLVVETPRIPRPGETVEGSRFFTTPGGKGANQAIAAARLLDEPGRVRMIGRVGADDYGAQMRDLLAHDGIDVSHVLVDEEAPSGVAVIFVDERAQNYVTAVYGANAHCGDEEIDAVADAISGPAVLLVQQEIPLDVTHGAMRAVRKRNVTVILDPSPVRTYTSGLLEYADLVTPNQPEAEALTGVTVTDVDSARAATRMLRAQGVPGVIVTMGDLGCFVDAQGICEFFPAVPARPVSTLAAGDAFNGGLAAAIASGHSLRESIPWALATAALSVGRPGAQSAMPRREEIEALLAAR